MTERDLLDALWRRLSAATAGGPPRYVMAEHVRHDPTWGNCIADAIAVDTWGSGRYELEGYEVKTTRSDWRRELPNDCAKSEPWRRHCTRWFIVAPSGVVPRDELPTGWGLIEQTPSGILRCVVRSAHFDTTPLSARQVAGLMRAVQQTATRHATRLLEATP